MAKKYKIREATEADLEVVCKLWYALMAFHKTHHPVFKLHEANGDLIVTMLKEKLASSETKVFLAELEAESVGILICRFQIVSEAFHLHRKAYIAETMVHEDFQGIGIGEDLYLYAESYFTEKGADHIELQVSVKNSKAIAFWGKRGFVTSTKHMIRELK